jgi:DNA-binding Lrp family transcriptional regulator
MKAIAEACIGLGEELASQGELFAGIVPIELGVCQGAKRLASTGRITSRDEARAVAIAACKLAGLSDSETARRVGCSRNTVAPVIEQLESSGRIPGLEARLRCKLGRLAESAADELLQLIGSGDEWSQERSGAVRALGVALGISVEKHLLVNGQSTAIVEQRVSPTADAVREWEDKLRELFPVVELPPSDDPSVTSPLPVNHLNDVATGFATITSVPNSGSTGPLGGGGSPIPAGPRGARNSLD